MTTTFLSLFWSLVAARGRALVRLPHHPDPVQRAIAYAEELLSERGEATSAARAVALVALYKTLTSEQRHEFHLHVARNFLPAAGRLESAAKAYLEAPSAETASALTAAAEAPRQELLRRMNIAPGATTLLMQMREEVLDALPYAPELNPLEQDLHHLLVSWFNPGFLELRSIDWNTPASILEKLIAYEAVHEIRGWDDLRRRLAPDRRCYAFFHPALPDEPLIFVEVALCQGIATEIAPLLANGKESRTPPDAAIFYSISNCQPGLKKISFGNFLIKQVVETLGHELPSLKYFATLSPIPGFRRWLEKRLKDSDEALLLPQERALFGEPVLETFKNALSSATFNGGDPVLKAILERLCAIYLTSAEERRSAEDPVARFHLRNGARVERINWHANPSPRGIAESYGLMVNYRYEPGDIEANHEMFVTQGKVAHSSEVGQMLKGHVKRLSRAALPQAAE